MSLRFPMLAVSLSLLCACGGIGGQVQPDADPTPPVISNLVLNPNVAPVGQTTRINATFSFVDPDGDVASGSIQLTLPDGTSQDAQTLAAPELQGATSGTLGLLVDLSPPVVGEYVLTVWLTDSLAAESNRLQQPVTVE